MVNHSILRHEFSGSRLLRSRPPRPWKLEAIRTQEMPQQFTKYPVRPSERIAQSSGQCNPGISESMLHSPWY